jgi:hypothetical protein
MSEHNWSGWPGAHCLKCGSGDPVEEAIADGWLDPWDGTWDTKAHELEVIERLKCSASEQNPKA